MEKLSFRRRILRRVRKHPSRHTPLQAEPAQSDQGRPQTRDPDLHGSKTAPDKRVVDMTRDLGVLRGSLAHHRQMSDDILSHLLLVLQKNAQGLKEASQLCDELVYEVNRQWRAGILPGTAFSPA